MLCSLCALDGGETRAQLARLRRVGAGKLLRYRNKCILLTHPPLAQSPSPKPSALRRAALLRQRRRLSPAAAWLAGWRAGGRADPAPEAMMLASATAVAIWSHRSSGVRPSSSCSSCSLTCVLSRQPALSPPSPSLYVRMRLSLAIPIPLSFCELLVYHSLSPRYPNPGKC